MRTPLWLSLAAFSLAACADAPTDETGVTDDTGDTADTSDTADTGDDDDTGDTGTAEVDASLRVVHASPTAPAVDVYVRELENLLAFEDLAYGDTSAYADLPPGTYTIDLRVADSEASTDPAYTQELTVAADSTYTTVAAGLLGGGADDAFRILAFEEDFGAVDATEAAVRIVHASADAPTVALDVGADGTDDVPSLERFADTGAAAVPLPAGQELAIAVKAGGDTVTSFTTIELPAETELFVIATGLLGEHPSTDEGFNLLAVGPTGTVGFIGQDPTIQVLHTSPDAPAVDIYAGSAELVDGLDFGDLAAIQVPPGDYTLDLYANSANGAGDPAVPGVALPTVERGGRYLAVAAGELTSDPATFGLIVLEDGFADDPDNARVRAVHASGNAPAVDIGTITRSDGGPSQVAALAPWTNVPYEAASGAEGVQLSPATYDLGVAATGTTDSVADFSGIAVGAGDRFFAVAGGKLGEPAGNKGFRLFLVDAGATVGDWAVIDKTPDVGER